ncbi:sodium-independent sulfate anion transporter-like isoform X2 [Aethina tumida]|uniref:sodium-independent sulfate anion transporter-like isoform X2 n=1 Tax=Aethina tumida TaxID=116153 RepID=UPI00096AEA8E|nr:sodium-independent sulfate anion transporter-like isoform X2 [Aethina tumida]
MINNQINILKKKIPILQWSQEYNVDKALADLVAGITVGLTLIPQSLAYAALAGLEPQYGLYSSLCGGLTYVVFGTIPELNIAPTALLSLLTYSYTHHLSFNNHEGAILLTFLAGTFELLCGLLHLGFLVDFVSTPVVAAFTSAGAITIVSSQVKNLFGLKFSAESFIDVWRKVGEHITELQKYDTILGLSCCAVLLFMRKLKDWGDPPLEDAQVKHKTSKLKKIIWFSSVSRNAVVVIFCATMAYIFGMYDMKPFSLTSEAPAGWPNISLPAFEAVAGNKTLNFLDMAKELGSGIFVVPFIAILGNVAIAKAFAQGKIVDASQEMTAVGLCNIFGSFFGSFPVNASFTRAAVSSASGVKTPLAGIYTGTMVILAFTFLTPYFAFIPKPTLSAVIICAVMFMVEVTMTKLIWRINKIDLVPFLLTILSCLILGIEIGILIGICVDIIMVLYSVARPKVIFEKLPISSEKEYLKITPTSSIFFPSAQYIRENIIKNNVEIGSNINMVVIDCHRINRLDFTAGKCLGDLVKDLKAKDKFVVFLLPSKSMEAIIKVTCDPTIPVIHSASEIKDLIEDKTAKPLQGILKNQENATTIL